MKKKKDERVKVDVYPFILIMGLNFTGKFNRREHEDNLKNLLEEWEGYESEMIEKCHWGKIKKGNIVQNEPF